MHAVDRLPCFKKVLIIEVLPVSCSLQVIERFAGARDLFPVVRLKINRVMSALFRLKGIDKYL